MFLKMTLLKKKKKKAKFLKSTRKGVFLSKARLSTGSTSQPPSPMFFTPTITSEEYKSTKLFETIVSLTIFLLCIVRCRVETITSD